MAPMQIVFLFDLNAFNDESLGSSREWHRQQLCLRLACLKILTHYSETASNLKWGFKFFNSQGTLTQKMQNFSFPNVSLESFEILENEIFTKYQRHFSYLEALAATSDHDATFSKKEESTDINQNCKLVHPVQLLHLALTQILCEYQWNDCIDMFSPCARKKTNTTAQKKHMLFLVSKCALNDTQFQAYFGVECSAMTVSKFTNILLSQSLNKQLLDKASILWVWLNTSTDSSFLGNSKPSSLLLLANTMKSLKCALVPLCVLSELKYILKLKNEDEIKNGEQLPETFQKEVAYSSLVPFSSTLLQSVSYPFYLEKQTLSDEAKICFQNNVEFFVSVTQVPVLWNRTINNFNPDVNINKNPATIWTKFTIRFAVSKHVQLQTDSALLLLPSILDKVSSFNLRDLIKSLMLKDIYLFVVCESTCGLTVSAVLSPLSHSSAIISILNPKACFLNKAMFADCKMSLEALNFLKIKKTLAAKSGNSLTNENFEGKPPNVSQNFVPNLKPFQMECIETWFEPTSAFAKNLSDIQQTHKSVPEIDAFHDKMRTFYKNCKKHKKETLEFVQKELPELTACSEEQNKLEEIEETYKDITYEQLISILNDTYNAALKSNGDVLHSAKKIIKLASFFFLQKSIISYEENMKNLMAEYFILTSRKIIEKYISSTDEDTTHIKKINECKLQALLALEMEILFPSSEESNYNDNVERILGLLSYTSTSDHDKFVSEVIKENYRHNLYNFLLEIGLLSDDDSVGSPAEDRLSGHMSDPFGSAISSTLSLKSSSSASSRYNDRKLIKKRSDVLGTNKSRQVLLPGKSPKRKKRKYNSFNEQNAIRYSPRLASKKKKSKVKTTDSNPETARRNLFSRDRKLHTPRTSSVRTPRKKKANTPKSHHVLKTKFVPETPSHMQNQSALQRRKSQIDITSPCPDVTESPLISQTSKGISHYNRLQKHEQNSVPSNTPQESSNTTSLPSSSLQPHHSPDSKRRLSLKLFSKVLASPTARKGLKKCSKRLFDQISPQVYTMPSKKIKLEDNFGSDCSQEKRTPMKMVLLQESYTPKKITFLETMSQKKLIRSQEKYTPKKSIMSEEKRTPKKMIMSEDECTPKKFIMSQGKRTPKKSIMSHKKLTLKKLIKSEEKCTPKKLIMSQEKHTPRKKTKPSEKDTSPC